MSINFQHLKLYLVWMVKIFAKAEIYRSDSMGAEIFYLFRFKRKIFNT